MRSIISLLKDILVKVKDITYNLDLIADYIVDTGWQNFTLESGFSLVSSNAAAHYRKVGKVVELRGYVKRTSTLTQSWVKFSTIPYKPSKDLYFAGGSNCSVHVSHNGNVMICAPYGLSSISAGSGIAFQVVYTVD